MELEDIPQEKNRVFGLSIISLVFIVIVLTGIVYFAQKRVRDSRKTVTVPSMKSNTQLSEGNEPRMSTISGKMGLSPKGATGSYRKGDTITLFVYADSNDTPVTGYDAVIRFNPQNVTFEAVTSSLDGVDVRETASVMTNTSSELIITGIKSIGKKEPFIFSNTALAEVKFLVTGTGPIDFSLVYEPGSSKESNLMNVQNQDILGSVDGTTITIK